MLATAARNAVADLDPQRTSKMGIRFLCPNGHKIHVKSHYAGRRAKCPTCAESVQIPLESTIESSKSSSRQERCDEQLRYDHGSARIRAGGAAVAEASSSGERPVMDDALRGLGGADHSAEAEIPVIYIQEDPPGVPSAALLRKRKTQTLPLVIGLSAASVVVLGLLILVVMR